MNPLQAYADSYRLMGRTGDGQVMCSSVAVDIERNMMPHAEPLPPALIEGLRALRLWHWQAVLRLRVYAADADMRKSDSEHYNKRANFHLMQVQLLNDFFPIGDTAEHDNAQLPPKI